MYYSNLRFEAPLQQYHNSPSHIAGFWYCYDVPVFVSLVKKTIAVKSKAVLGIIQQIKGTPPWTPQGITYKPSLIAAHFLVWT